MKFTKKDFDILLNRRKNLDEIFIKEDFYKKYFEWKFYHLYNKFISKFKFENNKYIDERDNFFPKPSSSKVIEFNYRKEIKNKFYKCNGCIYCNKGHLINYPMFEENYNYLNKCACCEICNNYNKICYYGHNYEFDICGFCLSIDNVYNNSLKKYVDLKEITPIPSKTSRKFLCINGHLFNGYGPTRCPICVSSSAEKIIHQFIKDAFPYYEVYKYKKFQIEFDIFVDEISLAIEYNGQQHYKEVKHWSNLNDVLRRDEYKKEFSEENDIELIIVRYDCINPFQYIYDKIKIYEPIIPEWCDDFIKK